VQITNHHEHRDSATGARRAAGHPGRPPATPPAAGTTPPSPTTCRRSPACRTWRVDPTLEAAAGDRQRRLKRHLTRSPSASPEILPEKSPAAPARPRARTAPGRAPRASAIATCATPGRWRLLTAPFEGGRQGRKHDVARQWLWKRVKPGSRCGAARARAAPAGQRPSACAAR
jgi:hypothetical protein